MGLQKVAQPELMYRPNPEMKRRTQHYGYIFNYRHRSAAGRREMPSFAQRLQERVMALEYGDVPNSVIINEYEPGQGIMPHVDAPHVFGTCVYALSLLSSCIMRFDGPNVYRVVLPKRSLVVMKGEAREIYKHSIGKEIIERIDLFGNEGFLDYDDIRSDGSELIVSRSRRVSLTFRRMRMAEE